MVVGLSNGNAAESSDLAQDAADGPDDFIDNVDDAASELESKGNRRSRLTLVSITLPNPVKKIRTIILVTSCLYIFLYTGAFYG